MPFADHPLLGQAPAHRLLAAEAGALSALLSSQSGAHGLYVAAAHTHAARLPGVACWTHLYLEGRALHGDVEADVGESLPFVADGFRVVILSHVLEWTPHAAGLLDEAARVLAPEGMLAVTGFHPFSAWLPWLLCRRRPRPMLTAPGWLRQRLARYDVQALQVRRFGACIPGMRNTWGQGGLGGGFVLVARKRRAFVKPIDLRAARKRRAPAGGLWVPGTHRECA